jgi:amino acid permease
LVNFEKLNYRDLHIRFRQLKPMQQAAIVGLIFLLIYTPYTYFLLHLSPVESVSMSLYSAIMFMVVYYFTSVIIMKKSMQAEKQSMGPKKGLRNK